MSSVELLARLVQVESERREHVVWGWMRQALVNITRTLEAFDVTVCPAIDH